MDYKGHGLDEAVHVVAGTSTTDRHVAGCGACDRGGPSSTLPVRERA